MKVIHLHSSITERVFLTLSGVIAAGIGIAIWTVPSEFYGSYGIELAGDVNLINELKAPAGVLFVAGLLILKGAIRRRSTTASMTVAAVLYLSFGASRLFSFVVDGMPNDAIVSAAILEIALGAIAVFGLIAHRWTSEF